MSVMEESRIENRGEKGACIELKGCVRADSKRMWGAVSDISKRWATTTKVLNLHEIRVDLRVVLKVNAKARVSKSREP